MFSKELRAYFSVLSHVLVFTFIIITATVVIHEYGHFFAGSLLGCDNIKVVLMDKSFETYTEMKCDSVEEGSFYLLYLSGFTFIIPLAAILFLLSRYEKYHSFVIFGFNLMISSSDISYFPPLFGYLSAFFGAAMIIYGETLLVDRYIRYIESGKAVVVSYSSS